MILGREPCYGQVSKFEFRVSTYFLSGTVHDAVVNTYENWLLKKTQCFQNYYYDHQVDFLEKDSPGKEIEHRV